VAGLINAESITCGLRRLIDLQTSSTRRLGHDRDLDLPADGIARRRFVLFRVSETFAKDNNAAVCTRKTRHFEEKLKILRVSRSYVVNVNSIELFTQVSRSNDPAFYGIPHSMIIFASISRSSAIINPNYSREFTGAFAANAIVAIYDRAAARRRLSDGINLASDCKNARAHGAARHELSNRRCLSRRSFRAVNFKRRWSGA